MADAPQAVILAAGLGTRMRSNRPKVLHALGGRPLIDRVVDLATAVCGRPPIVVINPEHDSVATHLAGRADVVPQAVPRGTGDALRSVPAGMRSEGLVVVLNADVPLVRRTTLEALIRARRDHCCALLTVRDPQRNGLGRVFRNSSGDVETILEDRDLLPDVAIPAECNVGIYAFDGSALWPALDRLTNDNAQGEYYLTDVITHLSGSVTAVVVDDPGEALGINDLRQLAAAEAALRHRTLDHLMLAGVTIEDPATTYIDDTVVIGQDSLIRPLTVIRGATTLGPGCEIGPSAQLVDVQAGARVRVGASVVEASELGDDVTIGHFDRVRPNSVLDSGVSLGTHAEVKNSRVGSGTRIAHFSCVLDADLGSDVNVGAGTVTVNYDGADKHRVTVGDGAFIGTNSTLVAPIDLAPGSFVAAGSVVTVDVPAGALAVGRARQRNIEGWVGRRKARAADRA